MEYEAQQTSQILFLSLLSFRIIKVSKESARCSFNFFMEGYRKLLNLSHKSQLFYCFSLFSFCVLVSIIFSTATTCQQGFAQAAGGICSQEIGQKNEVSIPVDLIQGHPLSLARRFLMTGPGSSPPCCASKCGKCTPCKPVHVPVPPGTPVTTEYYPEAWRCKCGNKLYMP